MLNPIPILDTHQHLIYPDQWKYSWTDEVPALADRAFRYDDYTNLVAGAGVTGTIFMETTPDDPHWRDEAKFVYSLAAQPNSLIKGVIANCRPEDDDFEQYVNSIRHPKLVGLRRILHVVPDDISENPFFAANLQWLGKQNLTFDLCFLARQLPLAIELIKKCPSTQFILDHCGVPDIANNQIDPWRQYITQLATLPNLACKISGLLAYCKPSQATLDTIKPYIHHCIDSFGIDRVLWGSDWPVCTTQSTLPNWLQITRELVAPMTETEQQKMLHDNAMRIYRVKE
jgi:predicted TIM-barrel fold metal-dependent hydrolase